MKIIQYCNICTNNFTSKIRHSIKCNLCQNVVCLQCFRTYLLLDNSDQVCMCCKEPITTEFIYMHTSKAFQLEYMTKITKIDFIKEQILLKATKERVMAKKKLYVLTNRIDLLKKQIKKYPDDSETQEFLNKSIELRDSYCELLGKDDEEIHKNTTSFLCPEVGCIGIVARGSCQKCKTKVCSQCLEKLDIDTPHECKSETLETLKLIRKETRSCPQCKVAIHKIDGCDQMFCTNCKTAFSWRTGQIQTGHIHNPHYFQWLEEKGRNVNLVFNNEDPCDVLLHEAIDFIFKNNNYSWVIRILEELNVLIPLLASDIYNETSINNKKKVLRVQHINRCDKISDEKKSEKLWFDSLRILFRRKEMIKDIIKILEVLDRGIKDSIIIAYDASKAPGHKNDQNDTLLTERLDGLFEYSKEQIDKNKKKYNIENKTSINKDGIFCHLIDW